MSTFHKVLQFAISVVVWVVLRLLLGIVALPVLTAFVSPTVASFILFIAMAFAFVISEKGSAWYKRVCTKIFLRIVVAVEYIKLKMAMKGLCRFDAQPVF